MKRNQDILDDAVLQTLCDQFEEEPFYSSTKQGP